MTSTPKTDPEAAAHFAAAFQKIQKEIGRVIVGQEEVIEQLLLAIAAQGHAILVGVPGLAKTLLVSTLSRTLDLDFRRIQFTPDLMPGDITGADVLHTDPATGERSFRFTEGPIFTQVLLADEINRTPPKTQAALLEAMQERQVTAGGKTRPLADPFFVLATQNPLEQEGTYPLPEAALDRFLFWIQVEYPSAEEEAEILRRTTGADEENVQIVLGAEELVRLQGLVRTVPVADSVLDFAVALVRASRPNEVDTPAFVQQWVQWGAGPRASQNMILAGKARALLHGRHHLSTQDIIAVAPAVLRHRILPNFAAQAEGMTADVLIQRLLKHIPAHPSALDGDRAAGIGS
ncbi:MAG: MoxR family ATPase [Planctomycetota bacterium]|nr:MoxR family ATPase [Planctomycetota bacterium]